MVKGDHGPTISYCVHVSQADITNTTADTLRISMAYICIDNIYYNIIGVINHVRTIIIHD